MEGMAKRDSPVFLDFGRHKGERITRVPPSYLLWMVNNETRLWKEAKIELKRRGTTFPEIDISGHAIDRASIRCLNIWERTRKAKEGFHAWLVRTAQEARKGEPIDKLNGINRYKYNRMIFVFEGETVWPVLSTVMKDRK